MKYVILMSLLLWGHSGALAGAGKSDFIQLTNVRTQIINDGKGRLVLHGVMMRNSDCEKKSTPMLFIEKNELSMAMFKIIIDAQRNGDDIQFVAGSCVRIAAHTYPSINEIQIR